MGHGPIAALPKLWTNHDGPHIYFFIKQNLNHFAPVLNCKVLRSDLFRYPPVRLRSTVKTDENDRPSPLGRSDNDYGNDPPRICPNKVITNWVFCILSLQTQSLRDTPHATCGDLRLH